MARFRQYQLCVNKSYKQELDGLFVLSRIPSVSTITKSDSVWFTTKGQVVIPSWLRKQFDIEEGTKCVVQATADGILLKPMTAALIKRGRGILKRKPGDKPLAEEWAEHKKTEKELEERHAR